MRRVLVSSAVLGVLAVSSAATSQATTASAVVPVPPVIAFVDEGPGLNVLHVDFATADSRDVALPPGLRSAARVSLPSSGSFRERLARLEAGPLGHLEPGRPVYVRGTRLVIVLAPGSRTEVTDALSGDGLHTTGVVDAALGRRYGTAPTAIGVVVLGSAPEAYAYLAQQPWADIVTTSAYDLPRVAASSSSTPGSAECLAAGAVRDLLASGRMVFSSSGNTTDATEQLTIPNGLPGVYRVGGVDAQGRTWLPPRTEESDPFYVAGLSQHPYDSGELFSFTAAAPDSLTGTVHFGGTSGATPRTAGRAAALIAVARQVVADRRVPTGTSHLLAWGPAKARRGPLADGSLSRADLTALLMRTAVPALPPAPGRYLVEGYGALNAASSSAASAVLRGTATAPDRSADDQARALAETARSAAFTPAC